MTALARCPAIEVAGALNHEQALRWTSEWSSVDVVVVDPADEQLDGDQFPGVTVVERVRAFQGEGRPVIIVVTGHFFHDGLRFRMAEVGADFFFLRSELRSARSLVDVVLYPDRYRRGVPPVVDEEAQRALGITDGSRIQKLLDYVRHNGLERALDPSEPVQADGRSRRWLHHRRVMGERARIEPVNLTTGQPPRDTQRFPSKRQLRRVFVWAAKTRGREGGI